MVYKIITVLQLINMLFVYNPYYVTKTNNILVPFNCLNDGLFLNNYQTKKIEDIKKIDKHIKYKLERHYQNAYEIANSLLGRNGSCYEIVMAFIEQYYGYNYLISDAIVVDNPKIGDIIYYKDGGLGVEHWAIYLNENEALHGNFLGTTLITDVYLKSASNPIFYRIIK